MIENATAALKSGKDVRISLNAVLVSMEKLRVAVVKHNRSHKEVVDYNGHGNVRQVKIKKSR